MRSAFFQGTRWMLRRPLSSTISAICLGLGMASSAVAVALIDATLIRPFGLNHVDRLVVMWEADPSRGNDLIEVSLADYRDWEHAATTFDSMAAFGSSHWPGIGQARGETFSLSPRAVSTSFFRTLQVTPVLGRDFLASDAMGAATPPVMLSHAFWSTRFGSSPDVIGESIYFNGVEHRVIGVMPRGFAFPDAPDVWISVERQLERLTPPQQRRVGVLEVIGRLKGDATREQAGAELTTIERAVRRDIDPGAEQWTVVVTPFRDVLLGRLGDRLWIALLMAAIVLLFACANVAGVRLAYMRERLTETAMRLYLGGSKARLTRDLTAEGTVLLAAAGLVAAALCEGFLALLARVPLVADSGIDLAGHRTATMTALVGTFALAWVLVALLPTIWIVLRVQPVEVIVHARGAVPSSQAGFAMLTVQAAIAMCLVGLAGGALQAFAKLSATPFGFSTRGVTAVDFAIPLWKHRTLEARVRMQEQLHARLEAMPGVLVVAAVSVRPFRFGEIADGHPIRRGNDATTTVANALGSSRVIVSPSYFDALGIAIVEGRGFSSDDRADTPPVAIVNRGLARRFWGETSPIGQTVQMYSLGGGWQSRQVIGLTEDVRSRWLEQPSLEVYVPNTQPPLPLGSFVVRTAPGASVTQASILAALREIEPDVTLDRVQTMSSVVSGVLAPSRLLATVTSGLGTTGLLLLALGIFGAAATALRVAWAEMAIRQAIGAMPLRAAAAPLRSLFIAMAVGVGAGLLLAPAALGMLSSLGVSSESPVTLILVGAAAVICAAALAIWPSLRRASRIPPAEILRTQ